MNQYDLFHHFIALKLHFNSSYDYIKYRGRTKFRPFQYDKRPDKFVFKKLSSKIDVKKFILANVLENHNIYSRDLLLPEADIVYTKWKKVNSALSYYFKLDLEKIQNIRESLMVENGEYPILLEMFNEEIINRETIIILDKLINFTNTWNKKIEDSLLWPEIFSTLTNYSSFLLLDLYKYKVVLKRHLILQDTYNKEKI